VSKFCGYRTRQAIRIEEEKMCSKRKND